MKSLLPLLAIILCAASLPAAERISDFSSRVVVEKNGEIEVTEIIRVEAAGDKIKRGIYRDFPTLYRGRWGLRLRVPFEVIGVTRDGHPEPWRIEKRENGVRIYIGNPEVFLNSGSYSYSIQYRTGDQLGFFGDFDELYWNVTGNDWAFPILRAEVRVELPPGAGPRSVDAYTGPQGAKGGAWRQVPSTADVKIETTAPLTPGEGLTIAVSWPKDFVNQPPPSYEWTRLAKDNPGLVAGIAGLLVAFCYFLAAWIAFGRDPVPGVVLPLYKPPDGFGPSAVRYMRGLGKVDDRSLASEILHLAVQGACTIYQGDAYTLVRTASASAPKPPGPAIMNAFFPGSEKFQFKSSNHAPIKSAKTEVAKAASSQCDTVFFVKNTRLWVVGLLLALIPVLISLSASTQLEAAIFMSVWLSFWSIGVALLCMKIVASWREAGWKKIAAIPITIFSIPFFAGWVFGAFALVRATSPWVAGLYVAGIVMTALFHYLLKRPTPEGRKILDEIEGFRRYLSVAEQDRLNWENPPGRTPEVFEKFLPYALALGVEHQWAEQFADVLTTSGFQPAWYTGPALTAGGVGAFATSFSSSFTSAISSSSTPPGSSSGGGGGGSSGGGGGGGGGGGW